MYYYRLGKKRLKKSSFSLVVRPLSGQTTKTNYVLYAQEVFNWIRIRTSPNPDPAKNQNGIQKNYFFFISIMLRFSSFLNDLANTKLCFQTFDIMMG